MKLRSCLFGCLCLVLLGLGSQSYATVINFSNLSEPGNYFKFLGSVVVQDGYKFSFESGGYGSDLGIWQNDSPNHTADPVSNTPLTAYYANCLITMTELAGHPFNLESIDLSAWGTGISGPFGVTFIGTKSNGTSVQQTFSVNNAGDSAPVLQKFNFSGFDDLVNASVRQGYFWAPDPSSNSPGSNNAFQFNNIAVEQSSVPAVPEPATILLFGSGMAGLLGKKIRRIWNN